MTVVFLGAALALFLTMNSMFVVGTRAGDNSLIDIAYGPAFVLACLGGWLAGGVETLQTFDRLLTAGGRAVLQVITMADQKYQAYRLGSDWIRKHIFPGGHLPSIGAMVQAMGARSRLNIERMEDIGLDYARTLELWRLALLARSDEVMRLGFDHRFMRKWSYYFSYCEAGFRSRTVRNYQLLLSRMGESSGACCA